MHIEMASSNDHSVKPFWNTDLLTPAHFQIVIFLWDLHCVVQLQLHESFLYRIVLTNCQIIFNTKQLVTQEMRSSSWPTLLPRAMVAVGERHLLMFSSLASPQKDCLDFAWLF